MATKPTTPVPDWLRLQRKIFTRWVNQKVSKRNITVNDVVTDINDGLLLVALLEVLSEKPSTFKLEKNPKLKPHKIDNLNNALKFAWDVCGIQMKLKPSAEQLFDGDERAILGLVWAIMLKYMRIGDDDEGEQLNFKDALLLWAQNKTVGYNNVKIDKFGNQWHDGLALCAIIHKHRPKLIPWDSLSKDNKVENLKLAMDAAERYFGLEKYLTPEDFTKLDENSLVVYVSEYYYGIAEQRKLDLAAKRIGKVVKLTQENDAMKKEYNETAQKFKELVTKVEKILEDRTIDNTMAGAKRRIAEFYDYKTQDKNVILGHQLDLQALYNNLAMRLSHHKRPEFVPPSGLTLKDIDAVVKHLEECEQERKVALHAELNRQIRLVKLDSQHKDLHGQLTAWATEKEQYLRTREIIESVSAAELQLRFLDAFDKEYVAIKQSNLALLNKLTEELVREKYERSSEVTSRDQQDVQTFELLGQLAQEKRPVLDDALAREKFKEKVRLMNQEHIDSYNKLSSWITEKENYLHTRENINSVSEARTQISLFESYEKEKVSVTETSVAELKQLGKEVLAAKYETKYSSWSIENPEKIQERESTVDKKWVELDELAAEKRRVLDDHLAREEFAEKVRMMNRNHVDRHAKLVSWVAEKEAYLKHKEVITNVSEARTALSLLEHYGKEKQQLTNRNVAQLKQLGQETLAQKYETKYSSYVFGNPSEISERETDIDNKWQLLSDLSAAKKQVLEDDLAREIEKERLRMEFARLASEFTRFTRDATDKVTVSHFGFTLEEVEAYQAVLNQSNTDITAQIEELKKQYEDVFAKMGEMGVTENVYTNLTPQDLEQSRAKLAAAVDKRTEAYKEELARQRANDALCKEFAALADPFVHHFVKQKEIITNSKSDLEEQLKYVNDNLNALRGDADKLPPIIECNAKMEAAGITNNRYTTLTSKDVEVQWEQYKSFLAKKQKMLEEEIEHHKMRGVTAEQFKEIEDNFKQFDSDKSGKIDKKELKACLYSLGEEKSRGEIDEILRVYGDANKEITYDKFKEFMIAVLGVSDTKDDILNSFALINKGDAVARQDKMELVMDEADLQYIKQTAPALDGGYDYKAWTEDVFSR